LEFEKVAVVAAPVERVWRTLLDPKLMGACVPGIEAIEVVSETEYVVRVHVKISFISARFKLRTTIVEMRPPGYLRSQGAGEDSSLTSFLKLSSELFLTDCGEGRTEIRTRLNVDLFGRLGTFGSNIVNTKADRMWDEFGRNLAARLEA
jgi:carbon monoxide dehydrogenase subunit G